MYDKIISQAPMMKKGTKEFRLFLSIISKKVLLYTEMFSDLAIINSKHREDYLNIDKAIENPVALQFGSSSPETLYKAVKIADQYPYYEFNLNCGCPSDRVSNGNLGAILMNDPSLIIELLYALKEGSNEKKITLKHRIGIKSRRADIIDYKNYDDLYRFIDAINSKIKIDKFTIHARLAILEGLSPKENREIPPLKYDYVKRIKKDFKEIFIELNGNIKNIEEVKLALKTFDAVMIGRKFVDDPYSFINLDKELFNIKNKTLTRNEIYLKYVDLIKKREDKHHNPRAFLPPLLQLFKGCKNAKKFRKILSNEYCKGEKLSEFLMKNK